MDNGVSKKLFITVICVQAIADLADGAPDKWRYALLVAAVFGVYKGVQGCIDFMRAFKGWKATGTQ